MSGHTRASRIATAPLERSAGRNGAHLAANDTSLPPHDANAIETYLESNPPTDEDILKELQGKGLGKGLEKVEERRQALISNVVIPFETDAGKNVLAVIKKWNSDVEETLVNAVPAKNAVKRSDSFPNIVLSKCLLNLYAAMKPIDDAIKSEKLFLRTTGQRDLWKKVFTDSIHCWINVAKSCAQNTIGNKASALFVALDARQMQRRLLDGGFVWTTDPLERACVCCRHMYTDMPNECKDFPSKNKEMNGQYTSILTEWQTKKDRGEKNFGNKPRAPKHFVRQKHCHCGQFHCGGNKIVAPIQCPLQCIDPSTGNRFDIVDGICQCTICLCNCRRAIKVCFNTTVVLSL